VYLSHSFRTYMTLFLLLVAAGLTFSALAAQPVASKEPLVLTDQGYFFVGGDYVEAEEDQGQSMTGQIFVHFQIPDELQHPFPIVMIHGGSQTGTNFMGTPDGREGWADFFVREGYAVYVIDQPGRGKSAFNSETYGELSGPSTTSGVEQRFTAPERFNLWPQAARHTQWPGTGMAGDPVFDEFFASQVPSIGDGSLMEELNQDAGAALLDRIGPAIILTHSQSGPFGWQIADTRPDLVKAVVAVEPSGGPFYNSPVLGGDLARPWGITSTELVYEPEVTDPEEIERVQESSVDSPGLVRCWLQAEPARQLVNLQGIPIFIFVAEASYHAQYDHCTARYLEQAGVENDFVRLEDIGIRGNGHMIMLEENSLDVAQLMADWLDENVEASTDTPPASSGGTSGGSD
jgi:pimeloyl-ACP methyl ester carboxylesterase